MTQWRRWLQRRRQGARTAEWTSDLTLPLPPGRTVSELVELIIQALMRSAPGDEVIRLLVADYKLSPDDAEFAYDRFCGGLVRASTRNPENCPSVDQDPIAWESFQRVTEDLSLIARVYPEFAPKERRPPRAGQVGAHVASDRPTDQGGGRRIGLVLTRSLRSSPALGSLPAPPLRAA